MPAKPIDVFDLHDMSVIAAHVEGEISAVEKKLNNRNLDRIRLCALGTTIETLRPIVADLGQDERLGDLMEKIDVRMQKLPNP